MGETYKGLTIRFGGDTTSLQQALRGVNSNVNTTNNELRRLKQALKFDPTSMVALGAKMEATNQKAKFLAERMDVLGREISGMGMNVDDVANDFARLGEGLEAFNNANAEVTRLNGYLAECKDEIIAVDKALGNAQGNTFFDEQRREIEGMLDLLREVSPECNELVERYRSLQQAQERWSNVRDENRISAQLVDLTTEFIRCEAEAESLNAELKQLEGQSVFVGEAEDARRFNAELQETKTIMERVESEASTMKQAFQFEPASLEAAQRYVSATNTALAEMNAHAKVLQGRIDELGSNDGVATLAASAHSARAAFVKAAEAVKQSNKDIATQKVKVRDLEEELDRVSALYGENSLQVAKVNARLDEEKTTLRAILEEERRINDEFKVAQQATELRTLQTELNTTRLQAKRLETEFEDMTSSIKVSASTLTTVGMALYSNVTPNVMMLASYSIEAADEIDSAYRDLRKTVQGTEEDFENLKQAALDFASSHITSASDILEIEAMGGQLGIAADELETFAEVCSSLDIATDMDVDEISEQLGQLNNVLQWEKLELDGDRNAMERYADALVRLGNNMPAQESAISDITSRIASQAQIVGMTTPEILAWSTAIAATGQNSEAAATAIARTMADIESSVATGSEALALFAEVSGVTVDEFTEQWKSKPSDIMQDFIEGLSGMADGGESVTAALEEMGITGVRQIQALEGLANTVDVLDDALVMSQDAWDGVADEWGDCGDAATEAAKKSEGFSGQLQILKNNASLLGAAFAESLTPVLEVATNVLNGLYNVVSAMPSGLRLLVVSVTAVAGALGPISTIVGPLLTMVRQMKSESVLMATTLKTVEENTKKANTSTKALTGSMKAATVASTAMKASLYSIVGVLGLLVVAGIISYFTKMTDKENDLRRATDSLTASVKRSGAASASVSKSTESYSVSLADAAAETKSLREEIEATTQAQGDLADSLAQSQADYEANADLAEKYEQSIKDIQDGYTGSTADVEALKYAVQGYNDATGSSIEVTDEQTGALSMSTDEIEQNTAAWKENAEAQAKLEAYREVYKQYITDQQEYNAALEDYIEKKETYDRLFAEYEQTGGTDSSLNKDMLTASKALGDAKENLEDATELVDATKESLVAIEETFDATGEDYSAISSLMETVAEDMGITSDALEEMGEGLGIVGEEAMAEFALGITSGFTEVQSAIMTATGMTWADFLTFSSMFGTTGEEAIAAYAEGVESGLPAAQAAIQAALGFTSEEMQEAAEAAGYTGEDAIAQFVQGIIDGDDAAIEAASSMVVSLNENLTGDVSDMKFENIGKQIDEGIADGISGSEGLRAIAQAARDAIQEAKKAANEEAQINSPAKLFIPTGRSISEGIAVGVTDGVSYMTSAVEDGIEAMRKAADDSLNASLSGGYEVSARMMGGAGGTTNNTTSYGSSVYINGATINDEAGIQDVLAAFLIELERLGVMQG